MNLPYRGDNDPTLCTEASSWAYPMCTCIFMNLPYRGDNDPTLYTEASLWTYPIEETTSLSYEQKHLYAPTLCTEAFLWAYPIEETASSSTCSANYRTFHSFFLNSWIYSKPTQPLLILTTNRYLFLSIKFSSYKFTTLHFSFTFLSLHNSPFFSQGVKILSQYSPPPPNQILTFSPSALPGVSTLTRFPFPTDFLPLLHLFTLWSSSVSDPDQHTILPPGFGSESGVRSRIQLLAN